MSSKKEDLLVAAEKLFYRHGFHAIGLKAIVQEAGIALMTLYNHFDSKEALILEILNRREQTYFDLLEQTVKTGSGSIEQELAAAHLTWLKNHASNGCMFLRAKEEFGSEESSIIVQTVKNHKENMLRFFQVHGLSYAEALRLSLLFEGSTALAETTSIQEVEDTLTALVNHLKVS